MNSIAEVYFHSILTHSQSCWVWVRTVLIGILHYNNRTECVTMKDRLDWDISSSSLIMEAQVIWNAICIAIFYMSSNMIMVILVN